MLFDLRSPGRRAAIKVVYSVLAVLLAGGLVLFGIGSGVNGGLFDAFRDGGTQVSGDTFEDQAEAQQRRTAADPTAANYAQLARTRVQAAEFDESEQTFTSDGLEQLRLADRAWQRHLQLAGDRPDANVAAVMQRAYDPAGLNEPAKGYRTMEIMIADQGDSATYTQYLQLAYWAYLAGNTRQGRLAGDRALELASTDDREQVRGLLDSYRQAAQESTTTTSTTPSGN